MAFVCPLCASDDWVTANQLPDGRIHRVCRDRSHGVQGYSWTANADPDTRSKGRSSSGADPVWVVLPPGQRAWPHLRHLADSLGSSPRAIDPERIAVCERLDPDEIVVGAPRTDDPCDRYVVFVYRKVIIAESLLVGNAAYVMARKPRDQWMKDLSLPKSEVPARKIVHGGRGLWKLQMKALVDHGPPLERLLDENGVPRDFRNRTASYMEVGDFILPDDDLY